MTNKMYTVLFKNLKVNLIIIKKSRQGFLAIVLEKYLVYYFSGKNPFLQSHRRPILTNGVPKDREFPGETVIFSLFNISNSFNKWTQKFS